MSLSVYSVLETSIHSQHAINGFLCPNKNGANRHEGIFFEYEYPNNPLFHSSCQFT